MKYTAIRMPSKSVLVKQWNNDQVVMCLELTSAEAADLSVQLFDCMGGLSIAEAMRKRAAEDEHVAAAS